VQQHVGLPLEGAGFPWWGLLAALPALALPGCTAVLDVDGYEFVGPDAAQEEVPALPLEPIVDVDDPIRTPPERAPERAPEPELIVDAAPLVPDDGGSPSVEPPPMEPPPMEPPPTEPLPRPVVVSEPDPLAQLAGSPTGGQPRTAICPGGLVYGVYFQYYTSIAFEPDRLSYVWPICSRLQPGTPNLTDGEAYEATWPISSPDDPVFAPLRENELIGALTCPVDQYVVGIQGSYDDPVVPSVGFRSLGILCAVLNTDAERSDVVQGPLGVVTASGISPVAGALPFEQRCPAGQAGSQLELRFGNWLDAIGLRCSTVRWPFSAGHVCTTPEQCQSGSCAADGACAP
jgi:hypothetical protein